MYVTGDRRLDLGCDPLEGLRTREGKTREWNISLAFSLDDREDGDTIHWSKNTTDEVDFGREMLTSLRTGRA